MLCLEGANTEIVRKFNKSKLSTYLSSRRYFDFESAITEWEWYSGGWAMKTEKEPQICIDKKMCVCVSVCAPRRARQIQCAAHIKSIRKSPLNKKKLAFSLTFLRSG